MGGLMTRIDDDGDSLYNVYNFDTVICLFCTSAKILQNSV